MYIHVRKSIDCIEVAQCFVDQSLICMHILQVGNPCWAVEVLKFRAYMGSLLTHCTLLTLAICRETEREREREREGREMDRISLWVQQCMIQSLWRVSSPINGMSVWEEFGDASGLLRQGMEHTSYCPINSCHVFCNTFHVFVAKYRMPSFYYYYYPSDPPHVLCRSDYFMWRWCMPSLL